MRMGLAMPLSYQAVSQCHILRPDPQRVTDYGADGSAGTREAYRNAGRDAARTVRETAGNQVEAARGALNTAKQRATAGVQAGRVSWGRNAAQGKDLLTKIKRAGRAFVGQTVMRR